MVLKEMIVHRCIAVYHRLKKHLPKDSKIPKVKLNRNNCMKVMLMGALNVYKKYLVRKGVHSEMFKLSKVNCISMIG